ncbi:DinB family protein [Granulicella sp. WH15]|uniref:DinB family protein n=1 Tax=Granulicella sp. WH15 TaxID=2602070 RepID=UPI001366FF40|nr:DinB family protein [Granulicella sp. WH15]QHN02029.1 DinB family protein [Granulicella sp. WH15]
MDSHERQFLLNQLAASEAQLLKLTNGLTPEQWSFRESPERWSIAENIEHCIAFEHFITDVIERSLATPADPGKKELSATKEPLVLGLATSRANRLNARETVRPTGRWPDPAEKIAELRKARARTIAFATEIQADLRDHFFPHIAFGDLDCYQWLLVIAQHASRHALQIEQIQADPAYPA